MAGNQVKLPPENSDCTSDLSQWYHCSKNKGVPDDIISKAWGITESISFMFHHRSAKKEVEPVKDEPKQNKKLQIKNEDDCDYEDVNEPDDSGDEDYK